MRAVTVLLHSTGTMPSMWTPFLPLFAPLGDVITPAHLGYPPNDALPRGTTVSELDDADFVMSLVPPDATEVHLVAHSYGGVVALELAERLGARLRSLFLYEPVLFATLLAATDANADALRSMREVLANPAFIRDDARGGDEDWIEQFIDYWNRPGSWARIPADKQQEMRAIGWKMYQEVRAVFTRRFDLDALHPSTIPVTLAYGARTPIEARAVVELVAARWPGATVVRIEGTGHMGPWTHASMVAPVLEGHVRRVM